MNEKCASFLKRMDKEYEVYLQKIKKMKKCRRYIQMGGFVCYRDKFIKSMCHIDA